MFIFFFFQAEDGIRDLVRSRGLGDVYKRQLVADAHAAVDETVALEELGVEFAEGFASLVGRIEDPLLHAQEILHRLAVVELSLIHI